MTSQDKEENPIQQVSNPDLSRALDYSHFLLSTVIDWYRNADSKAQIILTLDGALLTFLTSSIFKKQSDLASITQGFSPRTWILLSAMCLCLVGSILCALMCLWSRVFLGIKRDSVLGQERKKIREGATPYSPNVMFFFKTICWLDHDRFQQQMGTTDAAFQIKALSSQAYLLSQRVYVKHVLVNAGFVLAGASLILFLSGGVSYLVELRPPF